MTSMTGSMRGKNRRFSQPRSTAAPNCSGKPTTWPSRKEAVPGPIYPPLSEKGNVRQGFFGEEQLRQVLSHFLEHLQDFCLFGFLVGWRKEEISVIGWDQVEDDTIRLSGTETKNGEPRMIVSKESWRN